MQRIVLLTLVLLGFSSYAQETEAKLSPKRFRFNLEILGSGGVGSIGISKGITPKLEVGIKGLYFPSVGERSYNLGIFTLYNFERQSRLSFTLEYGFSYIGNQSKSRYSEYNANGTYVTHGGESDQYFVYVAPGLKTRISNSCYLGFSVCSGVNLYSKAMGHSIWLWDEGSNMKGMFNSYFWFWPSLKASFIL